MQVDSWAEKVIYMTILIIIPTNGEHHKLHSNSKLVISKIAGKQHSQALKQGRNYLGSGVPSNQVQPNSQLLYYEMPVADIRPYTQFSKKVVCGVSHMWGSEPTIGAMHPRY